MLQSVWVGQLEHKSLSSYLNQHAQDRICCTVVSNIQLYQNICCRLALTLDFLRNHFDKLSAHVLSLLEQLSSPQNDLDLYAPTRQTGLHKTVCWLKSMFFVYLITCAVIYQLLHRFVLGEIKLHTV